MKRMYIVTERQGFRIMDIVRNYTQAEVERFTERDDGYYDLDIEVSSEQCLDLILDIGELIEMFGK